MSDLNQIKDSVMDNANSVYYILGIIGILYTAYRTFTKVLKKTETYSLIRLITETPETIQQIKSKQNDIYSEIKLQGKVINSILDTMDLAQFVCDSTGKCIKVNSKWTSITGLSEEEAQGHHWLISVHVEDRQSVQKKWHNMIAYNTPFEEVFRYEHRITKEITRVKCTATDVTDENGNRIYILGLSRILSK
jgi:PAS domain S-box-containing protein